MAAERIGLAAGVAGHEFVLMPEAAAFWPAQGALLVADLHLGKGAAFRASGLGVPEVAADDLQRLDRLLSQTAARRLVILGDMFHAPEGQTGPVEVELARWRERNASLEVQLTLGNHDRECASLLARCGIEATTHLEIGGLELRHEVPAEPGGYALGGHLHPAVSFSDQTGSFRLPCFWFTETFGVLPAFGSFTGTHVVERRRGDRVFAIADGKILQVP